MRHFLLSALLLTASTVAYGEDLPNNAVITNRSSTISIYEAKTVAITNDASEVDQGDGFRIIRVSATLEIGLNVEGNLCGSKPENVFIQTTEAADQTLLSLHYKYATDPFSDILTACAAYAAPRDVTVALRVYDFAFNTDFEKTYALTVGSYGQTQQVLVKVRYEDNTGLVATIVR